MIIEKWLTNNIEIDTVNCLNMLQCVEKAKSLRVVGENSHTSEGLSLCVSHARETMI